MAVYPRDITVQEMGNGEFAGRLPHHLHLALFTGGDDTSDLRLGALRTRSGSH